MLSAAAALASPAASASADSWPSFAPIPQVASIPRISADLGVLPSGPGSPPTFRATIANRSRRAIHESAGIALVATLSRDGVADADLNDAGIGCWLRDVPQDADALLALRRASVVRLAPGESRIVESTTALCAFRRLRAGTYTGVADVNVIVYDGAGEGARQTTFRLPFVFRL